MSTIKTIPIRTDKKKSFKAHIEIFQSAAEVVKTCENRNITNERFQDVRKKSDWSWCGCKSYEDTMQMMRTGYQPAVDEFKASMKNVKTSEAKRIFFQNNLVGFAPIVPLTLKNIPNCMMNMQMKPIKMKVVDVYYDITASCGTSSDDIIARGKKLLGVIRELEMNGYRVNLYGVQTYSESSECDMLVVKLKSSSQPMDLKRVSFPLVHTAFFRVIGFDWYSKVPGGKYRSGYGHALSYDMDDKELKQFAEQAFGKNAILLTGVRIDGYTDKELKEVLENGDSENRK